MCKTYIQNVILILSSGTLDFKEVNGRKIIEYVIDAARKSKLVDGIVVNCSEKNKDYFEEKFSLPTFVGTKENAVSYVRNAYGCQKLIIEDSLCPMASSGQYDAYFEYLDKYNIVSTQSINGEIEPIAFNYSQDGNLYNGKLTCNDYPYSMRLEEEDDIKKFKELYEEKVTRPQEEKTFGIVDYYLSADGFVGIRDWIKNSCAYMDTLKDKMKLKSYFLNSQTEGNLVFEADSEKYGDIIIKFTPSKRRFHKEWVYYYYAAKGVMANMIEYDLERNILVLEKVKPGFQVKFNKDNEALRSFFDLVSDNMIPFERIGYDKEVPTVIGEFDDYLNFAYDAPFEPKFRHAVEKKAYIVWNDYFKNAPWYYLHRDLHKRNILSYKSDSVIAIDPMGAAGPKVFEYVIAYIIELREYPNDLNLDMFETMTEYFSKYVSREEIMAAMFFFFVFKMNDYCFQKQDNFFLASWCKKCIEKLYFNESDDICTDNVMPRGLKY